MKKPYFYIIQEISTGKYYAGVKYSKPDSSNLLLESGYKTTSKIVQNLIKKNGAESFKILKIRHFDTRKESLDYEEKFLTKVNAAENILFYNKHNGGKNFVNKGGYKLSGATKKKMSKPKSEETKRKMSKAFKLRPKECWEKTVETRRNNGKPWVTESQIKALEERNAKYWTKKNKEEHSKIMKEYYKENPPSEEYKNKKSKAVKGKNNPMYGKKHSEATRQKMKEAWAKRKNQQN